MLRAVCEQTPTFVRGTTALSRPRLPQGRCGTPSPRRTPPPTGAACGRRLRRRHPARGRPPVDAGAARDRRGCRVTSTCRSCSAGDRRDPVFSDLYLRDLVDRLPHADVHRYEGASHLVTEDAPAVVRRRARLGRAARRRPARRRPPAPTPVSAAATDARWGRPSPSAPPTRPPPTRSPWPSSAVAGRTITWSQLAGRVVDDLAAGLLGRRRPAGGPGRAARAARRRPDRRRLRVLAHRRGHRRRRRRARSARGWRGRCAAPGRST